MQLSQREAERQERRATNLIWNAARDYSLAPVVRAYDTEGFADVYMNSIIGAVYSFYEFPKIKEVLDSFERTPKGDEFEELAWIALENCAFERAAAERPALRELRLAYAMRVEAEAKRKGGARELDEAYRIKLFHYERALGLEPEMPERDRKILILMIPADGRSEMCQLHTDLMMSSGMQRDIQQRCFFFFLYDTVIQ